MILLIVLGPILVFSQIATRPFSARSDGCTQIRLSLSRSLEVQPKVALNIQQRWLFL